MNDIRIRSKLLYFAWIFLFLGILLMTGYTMYLKTGQISVTDGLLITLSGSEGSARIVSVENIANPQDVSKRDFLSSIEYQVYPDSNLENGQEVVIEALYSLDLLRQYKLQPADTTITVVIEGLDEEDTLTTIEYWSQNGS